MLALMPLSNKSSPTMHAGMPYIPFLIAHNLSDQWKLHHLNSDHSFRTTKRLDQRGKQMSNFLRLTKLLALFCLLSIGLSAEGQSNLVLPGEIAGYKVLATLNSEDTACMRPNTTRLVLQTSAPTVEDFLAGVQPSSVTQALRNVSTSRTFEVAFVDLSATQEKVLT